MTSPGPAFLDAVPSSVHGAWTAVSQVTRDPPRLLAPITNQTTWIGTTERHVVYLADHDEGRERLRQEVERRRWAIGVGIPVPPILEVAEDASWVVTERVRDDPSRGADYVEAAVATAGLFAGAPDPPAELLADDEGLRGRGRRSSRRKRVLNLARIARSPLDLREFAVVRRRALALPAEVLCHGDYHYGNILFDSATRIARITDLEAMGRGPRGTDLLTLWIELEEETDRDALLDSVLSGTDPGGRARLGILHHWLTLRNLADRVVLPAEERDPDLVAQGLARLTDARRNARAWVR